MDPNTSAEALEVVPFARRHIDDNHDIKTEDDIEVVPRSMEPGGLTLPSISTYPPPAQDDESYSDGSYGLNGPVNTFFDQSGVQPFLSLTKLVPVTNEIEAYGQPAMSVEIPGRHYLTYPAPEPTSSYHPQTTLPGLDQMTTFRRPAVTTYGGHEWTEQNRDNAGIDFTELNNTSQHQILRTSYHDDKHWPRAEQPIPAGSYVGHSHQGASQRKRSHTGDQFDTYGAGNVLRASTTGDLESRVDDTNYTGSLYDSQADSDMQPPRLKMQRTDASTTVGGHMTLLKPDGTPDFSINIDKGTSISGKHSKQLRSLLTDIKNAALPDY